MRLVRTAHPDKGGDPKVFRQLKEAYVVLSDDALRAEYEKALADEAANGLVEFFTDTQGCEWVSLSALRMQENTSRQELLQIQEENRKALAEEIAATDEQLEKKDQQFQKKQQELDRALQELETLASQKMLDDVRVEFEGLQAESAAASQQAAAEQALASHQVAAALAAQQINELEAALKSQAAQHEKQVAALDLSLKIHHAEHRKDLSARDEELTIKEAEYLQKQAQQEDRFLRLTTQLHELQRAKQHEDEALWTATEQVSRDRPSPPPPPPPPPPRCSTDVLNYPPVPDYRKPHRRL